MTSRRRKPKHVAPWRFPTKWAVVAALMVGLLVIVACQLYRHEAQSSNGYAAIPRPPSTFRFNPKPDITAYELSLALAPMMGSVDFLERMRVYYDHMPASAKRHWLTPETGPPQPPPLAHDHDHPH